MEVVDFEGYYHGIGPVEKTYFYTIREADIPEGAVVDMTGDVVDLKMQKEIDGFLAEDDNEDSDEDMDEGLDEGSDEGLDKESDDLDGEFDKN